MAGYRNRLAENAGEALAAAGSVLALGAALGAVGLSDVKKPLSNPWVWSALLLIGGAAAWCIYTFWVAMRSTLKTHKFLEQVGKAITQAKPLRFWNGSPEELARCIDLWTERCRALLRAGLGEGDAAAFAIRQREDRLPDHPQAVLDWGLPDLTEILHGSNVRALSTFDHKRDWMGDGS